MPKKTGLELEPDWVSYPTANDGGLLERPRLATYRKKVLEGRRGGFNECPQHDPQIRLKWYAKLGHPQIRGFSGGFVLEKQRNE